MVKIEPVLVCLIVICVSSCSNKEESRVANADVPIQLIKLRSWEINAPETIPHPYQAGILNDGSLILVDRSLNTINHFDQAGRLTLRMAAG